MQSLQLSPPRAATELLRRRGARRSLLTFTEATTPRWHPGKIHRVICEQLDRVVRHEIDRLMLLCPPQHGKSRITSERFPAYVLGLDPTLDIVSASAAEALAEKFGREVRNCVSSPEYRALFPDTMLAEDSRAKGLWNTSAGGSYFAVGVGSLIYGRGGMAIIDDPFGSWAEAQSKLQRDAVWEWYTGSLYNRIRPGQPIVLIQHRMHEDDLAGRLIEAQKQGKDRWETVELPALLDDPPWPERYPRAELERIRDNTDPRKWSALYLQNPTPDEGTFFKRSDFEFYDPAKVKGGHFYTTADFAVTEGGGDFTELATHQYLNDVLYLACEGWRGQTSADEWIERLIDQFATRQPLCFFGESGPIRRSIEPFLIRRMRQRRKFCRLEWLTRPHDKPTMARPLQAMASMRQVRLPDTEYGHHLLAQLLNFPAGQRDDAVDMAGLMALAIDQGHSGVVKAKEPKKAHDGWDDELDDTQHISLWNSQASLR